MEINTGLSAKDRDVIAKKLSSFLADSYALYLKLHNFHWNVKGMHFRAIHLAFEEQYTELAIAVDDIAERISALGAVVPGTFKEFNELKSIKDPIGVPKEEEMVKQIVQDQELIIRNARGLSDIAAKASDEVTVGLMADRMTVHEKNAWLLRSVIQ